MNKRFYRSSRDKMIAGVAGGVAEYFDIDPVLVRVAFVVLALSVGFGFLAYIVLWIIVPYDYIHPNRNYYKEPSPDFQEQADFNTQESARYKQSIERQEQNGTAKYIISAILIIIGILLLLDNLITDFKFENIGPIILILIGALILIFANKNKTRSEK
jgi:phage shock protein PspC (stress-responsive transcriptional regulator)